MRDIEELIIEIKEKMLHRDLSDEYLREHNHSTREEIGIGEYAYGITMIPCEWILPFLEELELAKEVLKDKCDIADERNQLLVENRKKDKVIKKAIRYCNCKSEFQTFGDEILKRALESRVNQVKYEIKEILRVEEQE